MEVGGHAACGQRGGDQEDLALVGPRSGQLRRLEEEVPILVGLALLNQTVLRVVALQFHHRPCKCKPNPRKSVILNAYI